MEEVRRTAVSLASDALAEALGQSVEIHVEWKNFDGAHPVGVLSRRMRLLLEDGFRQGPTAPSIEILQEKIDEAGIGPWVRSLRANKIAPLSQTIVPQANSYARLVAVMESLRDGRDPRAELDVVPRTITYYEELGEFLGWLKRDHNRIELTSSGLNWLNEEAGARHRIYNETLWSTPLLQAVKRATEQGLSLPEALVATISQTGLGASTVERRKQAVISLISAGAMDLAEASETVENQESAFEFGEDDEKGNWRDDPIDVLSPSSLLLPTLERLGARTVGDVVELARVDLSTIPGVGRLKTKQLRSLIEAAHAHGGNKPIVAQEAEYWRHVSPEDPWQTTLGRLSNKARSALQRGGFETLGDIHSRMEELRKIPAIGRKTVTQIREHFDRLIHGGVEAYLFGDEGAPASVEALLQRALAELDERQRDMIRRHELGEETLEEIASDYGITRERVRQIIAVAIGDLVNVYRDVATELLAPELAKLDRPGLLMVCRSIDEAKRLDLAIQLTGYNPPRHKRVLSKNERVEFDEQIAQLRSALEETGQTSMELEDALDIAESVGVMIEMEELMHLLEDHWKVVFSEGRVVFPWYNIGDVLAELLLALRQPSDVRQILEVYEQRRMEPEWQDLPSLSEHSTRAHLGRQPLIWNYGHGEYIHINSCSFGESEISSIVNEALERLKSHEDSIGAHVILEEIRKTRDIPDDFTPHILKDGIYRHPLGLTFKNNLMIARSDVYRDHGLTMKDRVSAVMDDSSEPMHWRAIARAVGQYGYALTSVGQMLGSDPDFVAMGGGKYVTLTHLGFGAVTRDVICDTVFERLPEDGAVVRASDLFESLVGQLRNAAKDPVTLERLARLDPRVDAAHGMMARSSGGNLLRDAMRLLLSELGAAYPRELKAKLVEEFGYRGSDPHIHQGLSRLVDEGILNRLPGGLYFEFQKEPDVWENWEKRRDIVVSTATHNEMPTHEPSLVWSLIRYIERVVDDDHLAAMLITQFLERTDLPPHLRTDAEDLQFALSMGMK